MASSGKKKTTMAKLNRESRLRERRVIKQAKKDARKRASADGADSPSDEPSPMTTEAAQTPPGQDAPEPVVQPLAEVE
jgi:hypothetical protein